MGRQRGNSAKDPSEKAIIAGGSFIRASYRISPLGEDMKNAIIALFQVIPEGQKMTGTVNVDIIDDMATLYTEYGEVHIVRQEHPLNRKLQTKYIFTVPMQFFIKGRRTDGRFYLEIEAALHNLAECRFTFVDSNDGMRHTTNTGIINDPETLSPLEGATGRNSIVTFSMTKSMIETIFNSTFGFHKFIESECISLTSIYAKRMYEILCSQESGTVYKLDVKNFKEMFCITGKYNQTSDLVKRILEPVKKEINEKTSLNIDYEVTKSGPEKKSRIINFKVLRNSTSLRITELKRKYMVWPNARLQSFLRSDVKMKEREIRPHLELFQKVSNCPEIMAELPYKWKKTCERISLDESGIKAEENIRKARIAHMIATLKGMLDDYGIE